MSIPLKIAEVMFVKPDKVKISVNDMISFKRAEKILKVGSYLKIIDEKSDNILIAIIESFSIDIVTKSEKEKKNDMEDENNSLDDFRRVYIIEASPLGVINKNKFTRGGDTLSIPPKDVMPASLDDIKSIFENSIDENERFSFSVLANNPSVRIPVNGNKFFNKHLAIVGASGSGKSHTVAKIFQNVERLNIENLNLNEESKILNNSHVVVFDIHSEYLTAFPKANIINASDLILPYWMLNDEELEELFLESGDRNNYNQSSILRSVIIENKKKYNTSGNPIYFDSPIKFNLKEVINCLNNISKETVNAKNKLRIMIKDDSYKIEDDLKTTSDSGILFSTENKYFEYFKDNHSFYETKNTHISKGDYADGSLNKFINRMESKTNDKRLSFLFGKESFEISFEDVIKNLIGYNKNKSNITIIDLSGIPFEVLSITVSLISRILFEFGYYKKKKFEENNTPLMLVYEEAHKYAPRSDMAKYRSSINSIERIAKEGRKYGVTLCIVSQRPSEISETIFSQCNNFVAMRLTNPDDQNYVKKLLPDSLDGITSSLPSLKTGEAIIIGDSTILPSIVKIDKCSSDRSPSSMDIDYLTEWQKKWNDFEVKDLEDLWI